MIQLNNIQFNYGLASFQLSIPNFKVDAGKKTAITGPSGCGKTTLLKIICGILRPQKGNVKIGEENLMRKNDDEFRYFRIRSTGLISPDFELLPYLKIKDNLVLPYFLNSNLKKTDAVNKHLDELIQRMNLIDLINQFPHELSQGEKQRVAIGRALITQPSLVLADEPTSNLDPENAEIILDLLFENVSRNSGTLVAFIHDQSLLSRFDEVLEFKDIRDNL